MPTRAPLAGQYTDAETGFQYLRARFYNPTSGRFLTRDPVMGGSCNDYEYVCADPVNSVDLAGNVCWSCPARAVRDAATQAAVLAWEYRDEISLGLAIVGSFACTVCTVAFYAGLSLSAASAATSCATGAGPACKVGVASVISGGASRVLAKGIAPALSRGAAGRIGASRWHPVERLVTGPIMAAAGRGVARAGFGLTWTSNGLTAYGVAL